MLVTVGAIETSDAEAKGLGFGTKRRSYLTAAARAARDEQQVDRRGHVRSPAGRRGRCRTGPPRARCGPQQHRPARSHLGSRYLRISGLMETGFLDRRRQQPVRWHSDSVTQEPVRGLCARFPPDWQEQDIPQPGTYVGITAYYGVGTPAVNCPGHNGRGRATGMMSM